MSQLSAAIGVPSPESLSVAARVGHGSVISMPGQRALAPKRGPKLLLGEATDADKVHQVAGHTVDRNYVMVCSAGSATIQVGMIVQSWAGLHDPVADPTTTRPRTGSRSRLSVYPFDPGFRIRSRRVNCGAPVGRLLAVRRTDHRARPRSHTPASRTARSQPRPH